MHIVGLVLLNLLAVSVFTGHYRRFMRWLPGGNGRLWDLMLGEGCSQWFDRIWAIAVFVFTVILLVGQLFGAVKW